MSERDAVSLLVSVEVNQRLSKADLMRKRSEVLTISMMPPEGEEEDRSPAYYIIKVKAPAAPPHHHQSGVLQQYGRLPLGGLSPVAYTNDALELDLHSLRNLQPSQMVNLRRFNI